MLIIIGILTFMSWKKSCSAEYNSSIIPVRLRWASNKQYTPVLNLVSNIVFLYFLREF